jgi:hypothetical protein
MIYSLASIAVIFCISSILLVSNGYSNAFASQGTALSPTPVVSPQASTPGLPSLTWSKTYGGQGLDMAYAVIKVNDGYVIAGDTENDVELVKTDLNGNQVWRKLYGGKGVDNARSVIAVSDGYVVAGSTSSYENGGVYDVYLLKTDLFGDMKWYKTFTHMLNGHLTNAFGKSVIAASDGYVIVGETNADSNGGLDIYLLKTDLDGNLVWNKTFGGDAVEHGNAIIQVADGYVIAGDTYSYGNSKTRGVDASDIYLVKTDFDGNVIWNKTFGGKYDDFANSLAAVDDGYVIVGSTKSYGDPSKFDVYLVKTDLEGDLTWEKHYGEADDDQGKSVIPVSDGYVITGYTSSIGNFYKDVYLLKTDLNGNAVWNRTYGGPDMDEGNSIIQAGDGFVIAGYTCTYGIYTADFYLLKIDLQVTPMSGPMATDTPTQESAALPSTQAGTLAVTDMAILVVLTIVIIAIAGGAVVAIYYYFPKK